MRPSSLRLAAALSALAAVPFAFAQETSSTVEERLQRLEQTVQELRSENATLRRELGAAAAGPTAPLSVLQPNGQETRLVVGGYLQAQAEFGGQGDGRFAGAHDRFYIRRARMFLAGHFAEHFDFKVEGEFAANTITPSPSLRASANELYVAWTRFPVAQVRFGQLKPAFGGEQLTAETRGSTIERYLGSDRLTDSRQLGMSVGGDLVPNRVSYLVAVGNGNGPNSNANDNSKFQQTARLAVVPFERAGVGRLVVGANVLHSDDAAAVRPGFGFDLVPGGTLDQAFGGRRRGWGADAMWHSGRLELASEFLRVRFEPENAVPVPRFSSEAWEVMAAYFVIPHTLQAVVRRESFDPNSERIGDQTNNWVLGLNYCIRGEELRLMVNYLFGHDADAPSDPGRLLTRFQILF